MDKNLRTQNSGVEVQEIQCLDLSRVQTTFPPSRELPHAFPLTLRRGGAKWVCTLTFATKTDFQRHGRVLFKRGPTAMTLHTGSVGKFSSLLVA